MKWTFSIGIFSVFSLLLNVWQFQTKAFHLINAFQDNTDNQSGNSQASQHDKRPCIIVGNSSLFRGNQVVVQVIYNLRIRVIQHFTDQQREKPQTDILNPENQGVSRTDHLLINQFRNTRPESRLLRTRSRHLQWHYL